MPRLDNDNEEGRGLLSSALPVIAFMLILGGLVIIFGFLLM